jgi:hypothetical protein
LVGQDALGSSDMASEGLAASLDAGLLRLSLAAGAEAPAGLEVPDGLLQAMTAPPNDTARVRASRSRFIMVVVILRGQGVGDSDASVRPSEANGCRR